MIEVKESCDLALIDRLRRRFIGRGAEERDGYDCHLVMYADGVPSGTARLSVENGKVVIDCVSADPDMGIGCRELLVRAIILRAVDMTDGIVEVEDSGEDLYTELGFVREGGRYSAIASDISFGCKCGHTEGDIK